jgi:hypothetical protein
MIWAGSFFFCACPEHVCKIQTVVDPVARPRSSVFSFQHVESSVLRAEVLGEPEKRLCTETVWEALPRTASLQSIIPQGTIVEEGQKERNTSSVQNCFVAYIESFLEPMFE